MLGIDLECFVITGSMGFQLGSHCGSGVRSFECRRINYSSTVCTRRRRRRRHRGLTANTASNGTDPSSNPKVRGKLGGALPGDPSAPKHSVTIRNWQGSESLTVAVPEDRYIWWYLREQGYELPSSCLNGCCTTCAAKVLRGTLEQPEALGLTRDFRERGYCLLCVSYPRSELELVLQDEDEVYLQQWAATFESGGKRWGGLIPEED